MNSFIWNECIPITIGCDRKVNDITFGGCYYYFTIQNCCEMVRVDQCFNVVECFCTCREYDCICFDSVDNYLWASSQKSNGVIYKLSLDMQEIDCIFVKMCNEILGPITGMSYNCKDNKVVISFDRRIIEIDKCSEDISIISVFKDVYMTSILSLSPIYMVSALKNDKQYIYILDRCGCVIGSQCFKDSVSIIRNIVFNPCNHKCSSTHLDFFVLKRGCYPHIYREEFSTCSLGVNICSCNYDICKECCCQKQCCESGLCGNVLESIALVETALARVLNLEGEKLQKILALTDDIDKILCVNNQVNRTIINATNLEHMLYLKISALCECGCGDVCGCDSSCSN